MRDRMMRRRMGRPGLLGMAARTAVVAGTATAVSGGVRRRSAARDDQQQQAAADQQQQAADQAASQMQAPAAPVDRIAKLKELGELKDSGVLTDAEFESEKARVLAS
jgi:membrane protease subunit (stomatin/prohibitin family)